jgi:putative transposase
MGWNTSVADIKLSPGSVLSHEGVNWRILGAVDLESVIVEDLNGASRKLVAVEELAPVTADRTKLETPTPWIADSDFAEAKRRFEYIKPLLGQRTRADVNARAAQIGHHPATLYRWIGAWERNERLHALLPRRPSGGRGVGRMATNVEELMNSIVMKSYLSNQKLSMKEVAYQVRRACDQLGIRPPHPNTVRKRIQWLNPQVVARKRHGKKAAERYEPHPQKFDSPSFPLALVEMDHTKLDLTLVDDVHRLPIGRPWLSLAIDVFSRMITGYYLSLDPTGTLAAGLCIAHSMLRKDGWVKRHGFKSSWPCWGKMTCVHVDNALEFRGKMLAHACEEYGIELDFRPVGQPHFGGHIERLLGTLVRELHKLPGTTFSNLKHKGQYDSEGKACFTFGELDDFIGHWIVEVYHHTKHREIGMSPFQKYESGFQGPNARPLPAIFTDEKQVLLDFMPFVERTIQRDGVVNEGVHYYHPLLCPGSVVSTQLQNELESSSLNMILATSVGSIFGTRKTSSI